MRTITDDQVDFSSQEYEIIGTGSKEEQIVKEPSAKGCRDVKIEY